LASGAAGVLAHFLKHGKKYRGENRDNRDNDEQFNEREADFGTFHVFFLLFCQDVNTSELASYPDLSCRLAEVGG